MPLLSQIIDIQISRQTKGVSQAGFGTPMILGVSNRMGTDLIRTYQDMAGVAADFAPNDLEYLAANSIFSQQQHPTEIKIGHIPSASTLTAALDAIRALDDDWYCLILTSRSDNDIFEAAAYIESKEKIFAVCTGEAGVLTSGTADVAAGLKDLNYSRTFVLFSLDPGTYPEAGWAGLCLPYLPGSETWKFKTIQGSIADALSATQSQHVKAKRANTYETYAGVPITGEGVMVDGEYIDVIRFVDWLKSRMQERIFSRLANNQKIPYTDAGAAIIENEIRAQLQAGVRVGGIPEGQFSVVVPKVADQNPNDRAARYMPGFTFTATLSGAIHKTQIKGTVTI